MRPPPPNLSPWERRRYLEGPVDSLGPLSHARVYADDGRAWRNPDDAARDMGVDLGEVVAALIDPFGHVGAVAVSAEPWGMPRWAGARDRGEPVRVELVGGHWHCRRRDVLRAAA